MRIGRLVVRDFRRFDRYEASLAPGLNVVVGDNEAGKSTIREALTVALFENPRTTDRKVLGHTRWGSGQRFAVDLDFSTADAEYRLEKDFEARTVRLTNLTTGETVVNVGRVESTLKEIVGIESRRLFESTVRFSQRDITAIQNGTTIADRLQQAVTGGSDDVRASEVLGKLDEAARRLKSTSRASPGPLNRLPESIAATRVRLEAQRAILSAAERTRESLEAKLSELAASRTALADKRRQFETCGERLRVEAELRGAADEAARLTSLVTTADKLGERMKAADAQLRELARFREVSRDELDELFALERQAAEETQAVAEAPIPDEGTGAGGATSGLSPLVWIGVALAAFGIVGALLVPTLGVPGLIVALAGLGLAFLGWRQSRHGVGEASAEQEAANHARAEILAVRMVADERRAAAEAARRAIGEILDRYGVASLAVLRARCREVEAAERDQTQARAQLEGLVGSGTLDDLDDRRRAAALRARDLQTTLDSPTMLLARLDLADYTRLGNEVATLNRLTEELDRQVIALQTRVGLDVVSAADVHSLDEELAEQLTSLSAAEEKQRVIALAREVLAEARQATMTTTRDQLESRLGGIVSDLTNGRYSSLAVSPTNLEISVRSPERPEPVAVALGGDLSQGTVEQVYLAARIALVELLTGERKPPLILDDPFVSFDATRTAAALALLKRLAADWQIILFTKDPTYAEHADHVVMLAPPFPVGEGGQGG